MKVPSIQGVLQIGAAVFLVVFLLCLLSPASYLLPYFLTSFRWLAALYGLWWFWDPDRALQTGAMAFFVLFSLCLLSPAPLYLLMYFLTTRFWWLSVLYGLWWFWDRNSPKRGGHYVNFFRNSPYFYYLKKYFSVQLAYASENYNLNSNRNYLFCCYPHGLVPTGVSQTLLFKCGKFYKKYPEFRVHFAVANFLMMAPIMREYCMACGFISCSAESLSYVLSSKKGGNIVCLFPGGMAEALNFNPGNYKIVLKNRKGFARMALINGVPLVPVLTFGENDLYSQIRHPWITKFQQAIKKMTGYSPILFYGDYGILPRKTPLTVLLGNPIEVTKIETPTDEEINKLHKRFIKELVELFEKNKHKYIENHKFTFLEVE